MIPGRWMPWAAKTPRADMPPNTSSSLTPLAVVLAIAFSGVSPAQAQRDAATKAATEAAAVDAEGALIRQILRLSPTAKVNPASFSVQPLRWQERYSVVFVREAGDDMPHVAGIGLYEDAPVPTNLLATTGRLAVAGRMSFGHIDLAPFRVSSAEVAIGLWLDRFGDGTGRFERANVLRLYLRKGNALVRVFSSVMSYHCDPDEGGTAHDGGSFLIVSKKQTRGYFDLLQRSGKATLAVFKWDGSAYVGDLPDDSPKRGWRKECSVAYDE
jgi:hypothetical protein